MQHSVLQMGMVLIIRKLIWDDWNITHIKKHQVTRKEIEQSLEDINIIFISGHSNRLMSLGRVGRRMITTVLQRQSEGNYYVVTARDMAKKEREIYRSNERKERK